jgi:uncharacterized protein DUF4054
MDITEQIISDFRAYYPEFKSVTAWPYDEVRLALEEGDAETGRRWGRYTVPRLAQSIKKRGMFAFAAHQLVMRKRAQSGDVGAAYAISGKSVGDESTSFAVPSVTTEDLTVYGDLPLTTFGVTFIRLRRRASAGPVML